jgi:type VI secretion system protein ImpE
MATPAELFRAGALDEAIAAATDLVKSKPTDIAARSFLAELLCFDGQIARADKQLEAIGRMEAGAGPGVQLFRQILRGEMARKEVLFAGRLPEFPDTIEAPLQTHLAAMVALRTGDQQSAGALFAEAEKLRPDVSGTCDGTPFTGFRDLDDLLAPVIEIIASDGRYVWIPAELLASLEFKPPRTARDLLWRPVEMVLKNGKDGEVFMPALYPFAEGESAAIRLGWETRWVGDTAEGPVRGRGRRCFLFGEEDRDVLSLGSVTFGAAEA